MATPVATPVAEPVPGGVLCTTLFGIALGDACVLVLHGVAQMGPVDVYVDGQLAVQGATFGILSDFIPVPAGERQMQPVDTRLLPENGARLRVIHASSDAPTVDLAATGGVPVIADFEPGDVSAYVDLPSGTHDFDVRVAGTSDVVPPLPGIALLPNRVYSVYVTGLVDGGSLGATLVPVFVSPDFAAATPVA